MNLPDTPRIHLVYGATASGKSAAALALARRSGGVIINADSQQLFAPLKILTARPGVEDEADIPHRLYGVLPADGRPDVAAWLKLAYMEIDWALGAQKQVYIVGGTGMYLYALMHGIADIPDVPEAVLRQAKNDFEHMGKQAFFERLQAVDAPLCTRITAGDSQRMLRGYSVWLASGKPLSFWQQQGNSGRYPLDAMVHHPITCDRETLYRRCDARVISMWQTGAVEEVAALLASGVADDAPIMRALGVRDIADYLDGRQPKETAIAHMQQATRNYAKRQLTWFKSKMG